MYRDQPITSLLSHLLPGYLKAPAASDQTLDDYLKRVTPANINGDKSVNYWKNTKKFVVSLLKDYYGESATAENEFLFNNLPKTSGDYSHVALFKAMDEGIIKGLICMGQNPAVGGPNAEHERSALEKLDWLIVADLWETETAVFWKRDGATPSAIKTEVFLLPVVDEHLALSADVQYMADRYRDGDGPKGWIGGLRLTLEF